MDYPGSVVVIALIHIKIPSSLTPLGTPSAEYTPSADYRLGRSSSSPEGLSSCPAVVLHYPIVLRFI